MLLGRVRAPMRTRASSQSGRVFGASARLHHPRARDGGTCLHLCRRSRAARLGATLPLRALVQRRRSASGRRLDAPWEVRDQRRRARSRRRHRQRDRSSRSMLPTTAAELARKIAGAPPIEREGRTIRLRPRSSSDGRRAATVNYAVRVPPETEVLTSSDSGATTVRGVSARLPCARRPARSISSASVRPRRWRPDPDPVARSERALTASSESGRVSVKGVPTGPWQFSTGSGSMDIGVPSNAPVTLDASGRSGSIRVVGGPVQGSVSKRKVSGTIAGGGALIRATSRSGSVIVTVSQ
jgi:hypothetical protein